MKYHISNSTMVSLILTVIVAIVLAIGFWSNQPELQIACTMEAKLCPDGSYVGRTGPNCEFTECPAINPPDVELSGIRGIALLGPMCPVERIPPDPQCADRPYKTDLVVTSADGTKVFQQFSSADNGKFSVELKPGEYAISSSDTAKIFSRCASSGAVRVEKGKYADIILHCDTGIR